MLIIPAIDLRDGKCVRLFQGRGDEETVYSDDPVKVALRWQSKGAGYLHLVDLDGAFEGQPRNLPVVEKIVRAVDIPAELGGGIRAFEDIEKILGMGIERAILGTMAISDRWLVRKAVRRFGAERIVVGIDARDGRVAIKGWEEVTGTPLVELVRAVKELGIERVIYTDIGRDGTMAGPNLEATKQLAAKTGMKVIASGGVSSLEQIRELKEFEGFGVEAVIVGKALYEGRLDLEEAIRAAEQVGHT